MLKYSLFTNYPFKRYKVKYDPRPGVYTFPGIIYNVTDLNNDI